MEKNEIPLQLADNCVMLTFAWRCFALQKEFEKELALLRAEGLKENSLRREYELKVQALAQLREKLYNEGRLEEEIAQRLHQERRMLSKAYKDAAPPLLRQYILDATERKYGDPLGPDYDTLRKVKTPREIIQSSSRPIRNLDDRISIDGFVAWYREKHKISGQAAGTGAVANTGF